MAPPIQPERGDGSHMEAAEEMEVLPGQPSRERTATTSHATQVPAQSPPPSPPVDTVEGDPDATLLPDINEFTVRSKPYDVIIGSPQSYGKQAHPPLEVPVRNVSVSSPVQRGATSARKHRKSVSFLEREEEDMDFTVVGDVQDEHGEGEAEPIVSTVEERTRQRELSTSIYPSSYRWLNCVPAMSSKARGKQRAVEERTSPLTFTPKAGYLNLHGSVQPSRPRTGMFSTNFLFWTTAKLTWMHYVADPPRQTSAAASNPQALPSRFEQPVRQRSREERPASDDPLEAIFEVSFIVVPYHAETET